MVAPSANPELGQAEEAIEVWTKDPSTLAFADLMNRAIGKPVASVEFDQSATMDIARQRGLPERLAAGRRRVAKARADRVSGDEGR